MDASSVPENGIIEKAEVHNLLSQLCCYLFPAQALGFCKWCFNPSLKIASKYAVILGEQALFVTGQSVCNVGKNPSKPTNNSFLSALPLGPPKVVFYSLGNIACEHFDSFVSILRL